MPGDSLGTCSVSVKLTLLDDAASQASVLLACHVDTGVAVFVAVRHWSAAGTTVHAGPNIEVRQRDERPTAYRSPDAGLPEPLLVHAGTAWPVGPARLIPRLIHGWLRLVGVVHLMGKTRGQRA